MVRHRRQGKSVRRKNRRTRRLHGKGKRINALKDFTKRFRRNKGYKKLLKDSYSSGIGTLGTTQRDGLADKASKVIRTTRIY